jgi:flagellar biosynthesis protein FliP
MCISKPIIFIRTTQNKFNELIIFSIFTKTSLETRSSPPSLMSYHSFGYLNKGMWNNNWTCQNLIATLKSTDTITYKIQWPRGAKHEPAQIQKQKHKYENTNANSKTQTQIQKHKRKFKNTNANRQKHKGKRKFTNANSKTRTQHVPWICVRVFILVFMFFNLRSCFQIGVCVFIFAFVFSYLFSCFRIWVRVLHL